MCSTNFEENRKNQLIIPHLVVENGEESLNFYKKSMNAKIVEKCYDDNKKKLLHSIFTMPNGGIIFLCDDFPEYGQSRLLPKDNISPVTVHLQFQTDEKAKEYWDSFIKKNESNGVNIVMEYKPQFWKENYGAFRDKYQHSWSVGAPLSDHQIDDSNKENCLQNHNVKKKKKYG